MVRLGFLALVTGARWLVPPLFRLIGIMAQLLLQAIASWWVGVFSAIDRTAYTYQNRLTDLGFDGRYDTWFYYGAIGVAVVELVIGWCVAAYLTVWLLNWLIF